MTYENKTLNQKLIRFFYSTMTLLFFSRERILGSHQPQRLKVRGLGVTLRGLKDQLNEFNQGVNPRDTRRVKYVRYKRPTLDDGRASFTWVELTNDKNVKNMFWEHNMFQWIDMRVTLLRSTEDIINSLIPPEDHD